MSFLTKIYVCNKTTLNIGMFLLTRENAGLTFAKTELCFEIFREEHNET